LPPGGNTLKRGVEVKEIKQRPVGRGFPKRRGKATHYARHSPWEKEKTSVTEALAKKKKNVSSRGEISEENRGVDSREEKTIPTDWRKKKHVEGGVR